jgi:iron complex transport system substrate-binding protein
MPADYTPRRVVCLQPSATVILAAIGELDRVVACTKYCADVCPEVRTGGKTIIADSWTAQSGEILAARPDLVIAAVPYQEKAVVEILKAGVRFLGLAPKTLADIYADIATIAGCVGASERGQTVIANMQREIETVKQQVNGKKRLRVFCEEWGKPVILSQRWVAELVEAAGGEFLGDPGTHSSAESVLTMDPDVVVAAWCGAGDRVPLEKILRDRKWQQMSAVREGRVYCISVGSRDSSRCFSTTRRAKMYQRCAGSNWRACIGLILPPYAFWFEIRGHQRRDRPYKPSRRLG